MLLGNEASDTGDYQVGIRLAHLLRPARRDGIKALSVPPGGAPGSAEAVLVEAVSVEARREYRGVTETFRLPLPCVVTVKEGINLPRYPSLPGRLRAKRAVITRVPAPFFAEGLRVGGLRVPEVKCSSAEVLGSRGGGGAGAGAGPW